jgi:hypothetical protein
MDIRHYRDKEVVRCLWLRFLLRFARLGTHPQYLRTRTLLIEDKAVGEAEGRASSKTRYVAGDD